MPPGWLAFRPKLAPAGSRCSLQLQGYESRHAHLVADADRRSRPIAVRARPIQVPPGENETTLVEDPCVVGDQSVRVQLRNSIGACWEVRFGDPAVNDARKFKAKGD